MIKEACKAIRSSVIAQALLGTICAVSVVVGLSEAQMLKIVGATANGPSPSFPTTPSIVCNGAAGNLNCPQYFSPDWTDGTNHNMFGITNVVNPPRCVKSVDTGVTWSACTTNPFASTYLNSYPAAFALTKDGALLAASNVDVTHSCVIRLSVDGGDSWSTVYTNAGTITCGAYGTTAMPSPMRCAKSANYCVILGLDTVSQSKPTPIHSFDNGATWVADASLTTQSGGPPFIGGAMSNDGSLYIAGGTSMQAISKFVVGASDTYVATLAWGGAVGGQRCTGPLIFNSTAMVVCGPNSTTTTTYKAVSVTANLPSIFQNFSLSDSPAFGGGPDNVSVAYDTTTAYIVGRNAAGTKVNAYITRDSFVSTFLLGQLTPTNMFTGCCRGDIYNWNGAIWFTSGGIGGGAQLMKIS